MSGLATWGTLAVAVAALVQPWAITLYKRVLQRPGIKAFPTGTVEVGYNQLGAAIGLHGTLFTPNKDVFVHSIGLVIVREADNATHTFSWGLKRGTKARLSNPGDFEVELPAGFILKAGQPHRYNLLFFDNDLYEPVRSKLEEVQSAWNEFALDRVSEMGREGELSVLDHLRPALYEEFAKRDVHVEAWQRLNRFRYWEPGRYRLSMVVNTSDPEGSHVFEWRFTLNETQEKLIGFNVMGMLQASCGIITGDYNWAYCDYSD